MCGIVGYIGHQEARPILVEGLHRLEYRGYDSAGVAFLRAKKLAVYKAKGKVAQMEALLPEKMRATIGIGHTRWATHGEPNDANAHPHVDTASKIAVIHNGIIENATELREELIASGVEFTSETDTEILAHLIAAEAGENLTEKVRKVLGRVLGAYGLAVISPEHAGEIVVARNGSPVVLGIGDKEMFVASDVSALVRHTQQVVYLDDGEIATLKPDGYSVVRMDASSTVKTASTIDIDPEEYSKLEHEHFTLKEIHEQPNVIERALRGRINERFATARLDGLNLDAKDLLGIKRVKVIGCGSALISGSIGARMIEGLARIPCDSESAAEFRYRNPIIEQDTLYLAVSQSGETFDTLAAVQEIDRKGGTVLGVVNSVGSTIARACKGGVYLHAGAEVAVVSTKTFTATLIVFALIALLLGRTRDVSHAQGLKFIEALKALPEQFSDQLQDLEEYKALAKDFANYDNAYFIGRNAGYDLAKEGALKLKEISYIHAEAYPAAELKHGPLALVSPETPTVVVLPDDDLLSKNISTMEEIRSRKGPVLAITQVADLSVAGVDSVQVPKTHELLMPLVMLIPLQLLAYYAAIERGCDVDRPRNLAKSVTVE